MPYVEPGGLCQAIDDEFEGLRCGVHCLCQLLNTAALNFALHTQSQVCIPNLICTAPNDGQKSGEKEKIKKKDLKIKDAYIDIYT